jgi:hypothetical protein
MTVPVSGCRPCSTTHAFYYLPPGAPGGVLESIRRDGPRPAAALPHHPRFVAASAGPPDAFEQEYEEPAGSLPGPEHENGGAYYTTVDFRCLPGTAPPPAGRRPGDRAGHPVPSADRQPNESPTATSGAVSRRRRAALLARGTASPTRLTASHLAGLLTATTAAEAR